MDIHGIPIGSIWTAIRWLPGHFLRKYFPRDRLAALQYVDLAPRHQSATINLGEAASFDVWLQIINLSPFEVELDRAEFELHYAGVSLKAYVMKKQIFQPGQITSIQISSLIPDGAANQIVRNRKVNSPDMDGAISGNIEFNCKLRPFARQIPHLAGVRLRVMNDNLRVLA
ncbi:hypothetical protein [Duganella sp. HH105]|uniref:hypothetical protein n=1 Tax=Duganella sp. HH105 TaxID=1781067 RepID=UPI000877CD6F|nr:hypothetical protein [Duganella sp. HH105]